MEFSNQVIVYLDSAILEIDAKQRPVEERVIDGLPHGAARQVMTRLFEDDQSAMQALVDRAALANAHRGAFLWTCPATAQVILDAVEMADLAQDPSATLRGLLSRLVEVASEVGPASSQGNIALVLFDKARIGRIGGVLIASGGYPDGIPDNLSMLTDFGLRAPGQRLPVTLSCCAVGARDGDAITRAVVLPQTALDLRCMPIDPRARTVILKATEAGENHLRFERTMPSYS